MATPILYGYLTMRPSRWLGIPTSIQYNIIIIISSKDFLFDFQHIYPTWSVHESLWIWQRREDERATS